MAANLRARQHLAERLSNVFRLYEHETDDVGLHRLARSIEVDPRDLRRWAAGTVLPGEVFSLLLGALPDHLADMLIAPTGKRLVDRDHEDSGSALELASMLSALSSDIAHRHADGVFCHVDQAAVRAEARKLIPELERMAREPGE